MQAEDTVAAVTYGLSGRAIVESPVSTFRLSVRIVIALLGGLLGGCVWLREQHLRRDGVGRLLAHPFNRCTDSTLLGVNNHSEGVYVSLEKDGIDAFVGFEVAGLWNVEVFQVKG